MTNALKLKKTFKKAKYDYYLLKCGIVMQLRDILNKYNLEWFLWTCRNLVKSCYMN